MQKYRSFPRRNFFKQPLKTAVEQTVTFAKRAVWINKMRETQRHWTVNEKSVACQMTRRQSRSFLRESAGDRQRTPFSSSQSLPLCFELRVSFEIFVYTHTAFLWLPLQIHVGPALKKDPLALGENTVVNSCELSDNFHTNNAGALLRCNGTAVFWYGKHGQWREQHRR